VANQIPGRLRALVFIDAFVPADGDSLIDVQGEGPPRACWKKPPGEAIRSGIAGAAPQCMAFCLIFHEIKHSLIISILIIVKS
jgi:hypothetical protein